MKPVLNRPETKDSFDGFLGLLGVLIFLKVFCPHSLISNMQIDFFAMFLLQFRISIFRFPLLRRPIRHIGVYSSQMAVRRLYTIQIPLHRCARLGRLDPSERCIGKRLGLLYEHSLRLIVALLSTR